MQFHLNKYNTRREVEAAFRRIPYPRGSTNTASALNTLRELMFSAANGDRADVPNVAIVITDGDSNDRERTVEAALRAKQADIDITSIGIGGWVNIDELDAIAGFPSSTHKILVDDFSKLPALVDSVQQTICGGKWA